MFELNERTGECTRIDTGFNADLKDDNFIKELEAEGIKLKTIVLEYTTPIRVIRLENVSSYEVVSGAAGKLIRVRQFNKEEDGWKETTKYYTTYGLFFVGPFDGKDETKMSSGYAITNGLSYEDVMRQSYEQRLADAKLRKEYCEKYPDVFGYSYSGTSFGGSFDTDSRTSTVKKDVLI